MKHYIITLIVCVVAVLGCVIFFANARKNPENDTIKEVTVSADGTTNEQIKDITLGLNPSQQQEYEIHLKCTSEGKYRINLSFKERNNGNMKKFVNVAVSADGKSVYSGTLTELLDGGKDISFDSDIKTDTPTKIKITYSMSHEVGNEAQGTLSTFDILLSAQGTAVS